MVQENPGSLEEDLPQTPEPQPIGLQRSPFGHTPTALQPITEQGHAPLEISLSSYILSFCLFIYQSRHSQTPSLFGFSCFVRRGWSLYNQKQQGRSQHVVQASHSKPHV